jgi:hypothetical protein
MAGGQAAPRTYGGWRRRRPVGLLGLGPVGTIALFGAVIAVLASVAVSARTAEIVAPPVLTGCGVGLARVNGVPLATLAAVRIRWHHASVRDRTSFRAGTVTALPGAFQLPGVLAATALLSAEDDAGGAYGLVWDRHSGYLTATVSVTPASAWLADPADADTWVAGWGGWLASLGHLPAVRWVTVTTDTFPEPGTRLADEVAASLSPAAPAAARQIITAVAAAAPQAAASTAVRVSVTFDPAADPSRPAGLAAAAAVVTRAMSGLLPGLGACGVSADRLASAAEIAGAVRAAYDPHSRGEVARLLAATRAGRDPFPLTWLDAGPVGATEMTDSYQHDGGLSVTWGWHEAPRQNVTAAVLARLAGPAPFGRRLTLQYRPLPAATAARVIEAEVNAAGFRDAYRRKTGRDATARDSADSARAAQAAAEEAAGAGVVLIGLYVSVTVTEAGDLARAVAATEAAAGESRIRLRRLYNSQAAGFATGLPCGICPPDLSRRWPR